jgi:hypothetical protein
MLPFYFADKSAVKAFFIDGYNQQSDITVNESDNLLFRCHIESRPISTTSIHFESGETLDVSQSNDVSYNIRSVTCQQAGKYVCSGRNKHNGQDMAKQTLLISINCKYILFYGSSRVYNIVMYVYFGKTILFIQQ